MCAATLSARFIFTELSFISWFHSESLEVGWMCEGFAKRREKFPQPKPCAKTRRGEPSKNKTDETMKKALTNIF